MVSKRTLPIPEDQLMDDVHIQSGTVTVRLGFYKVGRLQYISHLDLQRSMKRAFLRSGLPIWFSEGFNPHPKMVFSTPLSIGIESECEFADVKFTRPVTPKEVMDGFNACMTDELQLFYAAPPVCKMTDVAWAVYEIVMKHPMASAETAEKLDMLFTHPLVMTKKSKSGDKDVDIAPYIKDPKTVYDAENGVMRLHVLLCADNANFLNPEYLMKAAERELGLSFEDPEISQYTVKRTNLLLADGISEFT